jgi:hypothetical protein
MNLPKVQNAHDKTAIKPGGMRNDECGMTMPDGDAPDRVSE